MTLMASHVIPASASGSRAESRIRLRLVLFHRWIAIAGQLLTVLVTYVGLGFPMPLLPVLSLIFLSAALNVSAIWQLSDQPWLKDGTAFSFMAYDVLQLTLLLMLTGGISNPFAVLILAPVTVAAAILSFRYVLILSSLAIIGISAMSLWSGPLPWSEPGSPILPPLYLFGLWAGLVSAVVFISTYVFGTAEEGRRMSRALTETKLALNREQKASALGALAAAAAHELGSPLGTIAVIANDLVKGSAADSAFHEDVVLLQEQVQRCRRILQELSASSHAETDDPFRFMRLTALIDAIAAPYKRESVLFEVVRLRGDSQSMPVGERTPELVHGLGNILQNALQFAESRVVAECEWDRAEVVVRVRDDGPGFPQHSLTQLGEPFHSTRAGKDGHMGLGLFIAQTLLGHTGASLRFSNARTTGAVVEMVWPRTVFDRRSDPAACAALHLSPAPEGHGPTAAPSTSFPTATPASQGPLPHGIG